MFQNEKSVQSNFCVTVRKKVKNFRSWSFAINESTNQKDIAQLAIFLNVWRVWTRCGQGVEYNRKTFVTTAIKDIATGEDIFTEVLHAFKNFGRNLSILCRVSTDGGRAMSGTGFELVGLLKSALREKDINDDIAIFYCIIHQQNLCAKSLN